MTAQGNGPPLYFKVRMSDQIKKQVKELHLQAAQDGKGSFFLAALRKIIDKLRKDPWTFGEPLYSLPFMRLKVRKAVIAPVAVVYGVHEEKPLVFIRDFRTLS
jgi:hypothetical protein